MKVHVGVKTRCKECKIIRREGVVLNICKVTPRHKQRQG